MSETVAVLFEEESLEVSPPQDQEPSVALPRLTSVQDENEAMPAVRRGDTLEDEGRLSESQQETLSGLGRHLAKAMAAALRRSQTEQETARVELWNHVQKQERKVHRTIRAVLAIQRRMEQLTGILSDQKKVLTSTAQSCQELTDQVRSLPGAAEGQSAVEQLRRQMDNLDATLFRRLEEQSAEFERQQEVLAHLQSRVAQVTPRVERLASELGEGPGPLTAVFRVRQWRDLPHEGDCAMPVRQDSTGGPSPMAHHSGERSPHSPRDTW